ncbi:hypothetical protein C2S51_029555 [Perilla frutescens var. frutescens]|nr:hypothetical protein C2S51_029555 [Perilla frutescens var. frutescens]
MSLITLSVARNFVSLKHLGILICDEIVEVIKDEEEEEAVIGGGRTLLFPQLEKLELRDLCKLVSFCKGNCYVNCKIVLIEGCSNMKIFKLESHVSFSFNGLEHLTISRYEGNMSLFSSSIARNLVSLRKLKISDCKEMVKVIEDEKEEENVVSSGGAQTTTTILFPKLQWLQLRKSLKLESFCQWKCDIMMPSLKEVVIINCDDMRTFTLGPLTTPNLETAKIDDEDFGGEKDLNGMLNQQYLIRMVRITNIF